jgi:hypothetical protein
VFRRVCVVKTLRPLARMPATRMGSGNLEIIAADAMAFLANEGEAPTKITFTPFSCLAFGSRAKVVTSENRGELNESIC